MSSDAVAMNSRSRHVAYGHYAMPDTPPVSTHLLQVLRRTAHGFTNPANFEARGILVT